MDPQVLGKKLGALAQSSFASLAEHYERGAAALNKFLVGPFTTPWSLP